MSDDRALPNKDMQAQIEDLQSRLSFQEDMLQALNETVAQQDTVIMQLRQQLKHYQERLDNVAFL